MTLRDEIVTVVNYWHQRAELAKSQLIAWCGLSRNRFGDWEKRFGKPNEHNAAIPKKHWILEWERKAIIRYGTENLEAGYRRITYLMLDENIVAVSPSTTYRVLLRAGLLSRRPHSPSKKGTGFEQPLKPHEHWHIDFTYLRFGGQFYFMVLVLDGFSRAILSWGIDEAMTEAHAEIAVQKARENHPGHNPRIISDNGSQFLAKDFKEFIKICEMTHVTTSPYYPQSNGKLERFNRTMKGECIRNLCPLDLADGRRVAGHYIKDYNEVRLHSAISYITPMDRLHNRHELIQAGRNQKLEEARLVREKAFEARSQQAGETQKTSHCELSHAFENPAKNPAECSIQRGIKE